jgi:hypothetical protein
MEIRFIEIYEIKIAEIISDTILIAKTQDALDIMADCNYLGSWKIILHAKNIIADFFDLKSGIAGDILQKFSTYNVQLAIVGDYSTYTSKSLEDFIFESNKVGHINFVHSTEEAIQRLLR